MNTGWPVRKVATATVLAESLIGELRASFAGDFHTDLTTRRLYATDASVYQQLPVAVAFPRTREDIPLLLELARKTGIGLIPRTAGTSLAGQVVGDGIVIDMSRHFTKVLEINPEERWALVEPGVIRNELNQDLLPYGLMFGPETSTANRAMIGGMLGNNSCGANSIVYQTTRDQTLSVYGYLASGEYVVFGEKKADSEPGSSPHRERIVQGMHRLLSDPKNQQSIRHGFPKPEIRRRNTGYALDALLDMEPYRTGGPPFNLSALIAGSEGTLFLATEIRLRLHPLPPCHRVLICAHFADIDSSLRSVATIMQHDVYACELIDSLILEGASRNPGQRNNMAFVEGKPAAILLVEVRDDDPDETLKRAGAIVNKLQSAGLGYAWPMFTDNQADPVWELRRAGLGVAANVVGDTKPWAVIEDAAVSIPDFANYIRDVGRLLGEKYRMPCVHYGHAGAGELHLRPVLNLKTEQGVADFRNIALDVAAIVARYRGSLSGEHGDGRLRGELIESIVGTENYRLFQEVKRLWDPDNLLNPGKIVNAPPLNQNLRFDSATTHHEIETTLDFSSTEGLLRAAEMCSGSGDCRKTARSGGTMCPSYMVTREERDSTRGRANMLRQILAGAVDRSALASPELQSVLDLCLSCKGCKNECPSNVDMAKLKAECTQAAHEVHGVPLRSRLIAGVNSTNRVASWFPGLYNGMIGNRVTGGIIKRLAGFHSCRSLPPVQSRSLRKWFSWRQNANITSPKSEIILFCDEFTNYLDTPVGIACVELLEKLGYRVRLIDHEESGRAAISCGMLKKAASIANRNIELLGDIVSADRPLIGIEPSAILTLVDEYPDIVRSDLKSAARHVADNTLLIDQFISREWLAGRIRSESFEASPQMIRLHGHCHQKALTSLADTVRMLQIPENYRVKLIPSGCCGMAGAFGYHREHYDLSMKIGELILFPTVRNEPESSLIAAGGTSCRHQILDGTGRTALHPVQILRQALL